MKNKYWEAKIPNTLSHTSLSKKYIKTIEDSKTVKILFPPITMKETEEITKNMCKWIKENKLKKINHQIYFGSCTGSDYAIFRFKREQDAIAFKLKWS